LFHARILRIHSNGETSSIVGKFDNQNAALERARNDIEFPGHLGDVVATMVLTTDPIAHYQAVEDGVRSNGRQRYKAEKVTTS